MKKIAYIVSNEMIGNSVRKILADAGCSGEVDVQRIDVHRILSEYRRLCSEGYSCFIARGGTYRELAGIADAIPVCEAKVTTEDILNALAGIAPRDNETIHLVLHEDVGKGIENLAGLVNFSIDVKRYSTLDQLEECLGSIAGPGTVVVSSGVAGDISGRSDLDFVELANRPAAVMQAVNEARRIREQLKDSLQHASILDSIYNNVDEGIVIFDPDYRITSANRLAEVFLRVPMDEIIGANIRSLVREMPEQRKDGSCSIDSPRNFVGNMVGKKLAYSIYPFKYNVDEKRFLMTIQEITKVQETERDIRLQLARKGLTADHTFRDILTEDAGMKKVIRDAMKVAAFDGSVLIYGESGTGKELFAQSIHNASSRRKGPFVAVNCGALTESLLESELFGYVGGAFTGARKEGKAGLFELAHQGTIFLDEINSTPLSLQTKILRVIEEQEVMRVGSDYVIPLDVRIISASNADLGAHMEDGTFRPDLYYRLSTFRVSIPPVRERRDDILLLFDHYLEEFNKDGEELPPLSDDFRQKLLSHEWRGNVREIRSTALRYYAYRGDDSGGSIIDMSAEETAPEIVGKDMKIDLKGLSSAVENLVIDELEERGMTKSEIAAALGISRQALYKRMKNREQ
jgi:propionate catabolism operon transcriptional regulator